MKNEKSKTKNIRRMVFLFLISSFLFFTGCPDPFVAHNAANSKGSFSLMLSEGRTVLPSSPGLGDFAVYNLAFTPTSGGSPVSVDRTNATLSKESVLLEPGTYNLTVNAYKDSNKSQLMARGTSNGIVINAGQNTAMAVTLEALLTGGTGTFSWNITVPQGVTAAFMTITPANTGGTAQQTVTLFSEAGGSRTLNSDQYSLIFNMEKTDGKSVEWNELLYVYQNLDSNLTFTFTNAHFSESSYTVTYISNGGTSVGVQSVLHGGAVPSPAIPTKDGFTFTGWYTDNNTFANAWNFSNAVTGNITLYAKWEILTISKVNIVVIPPVTGAKPTKVAHSTGNYTIGEVSWLPTHDPFQDSTVYTATFVLTAENGYTFSGLTADVTGENATVTVYDNMAVISRTFPITDDTAINKFLANSYVGNDRVKYSFSYGEYDFYYIYLGEMANIPVYTFPVKQHNGQPGNIYTVSMTNQTINTVEQTVTTYVENTKTTIDEYSYSTTTGEKLSSEIGGKISALKGLVSMDVAKVSAEYYWQDYIAYNTTLINQQKTSLAETIREASTHVFTYTVSDSFDLGYRKAGYYRYTWFSVSDVYLYVIRNSIANELVYYEFKEHVKPGVFFWALDYSATPSFTKSDATSFNLDISVLDNLPKPSLHFGFPVTSTAEWNNALAAIRNGGSGTADAPKAYNIFVTGNVTVPGSTSVSTSFGSVQYVEVTIKGDGKLSLDSNGRILILGNNQKLIVDDEQLILHGRSGNNGAVLNIGNGGMLELKNGAITGNNNSFGFGGGVYVGTSGTFTMGGGTISGNISSSDFPRGGGVYVDGGTLTMCGGIISGNTASANAPSGLGGGVYVINGTFTMSNGTISGNTSYGGSDSFYGESYGGGVYVSNSTFTMNGGTISGNTASVGASGLMGGNGGGVSVRDSSTFTMSGGTISGNTILASASLNSGGNGGGVYVSNSNFTMSNGIISGNTVYRTPYTLGYGGGVYVSGTFDKTGGTITGYANDTANGNVVRNSSGVESNMGHAVYAYYGLNTNNIKRKETTAGTGVNLSTNRSTGTFSGGWDY